MKKVFLLGVGCQKGGTTWLCRYLHSHPNVSLGLTKEYHVFDVLYLDKSSLGRLPMRASPLYRSILPSDFAKWRLRRKLASFRKDPERYFDFFRKLAHSSSSISVVGDITPSYAMLPSEGFRRIHDGLKERDFDVKVLFLMRDPVQRCLSAVRMARYGKHLSPAAQKFATEASHLRALYKTVRYRKRTAYEQTIQSLEQVFEKKDILYLFYESLFRDSTIRKVLSFLNLPFVQADFDRRFNSSKRSVEIDRELTEEVFDFYLPTYEFIAGRFGEQAVQENWSTYRQLSRRKKIA